MRRSGKRGVFGQCHDHAIGFTRLHGRRTNAVCLAVSSIIVRKDINSGPFSYDLFIPTAAQLIEYLHQSEFKCPEDIARAPFEYAFKAPHWEYLKHHPVHRARVDAYMAGRREGKLRWLDVFPAASQLGAGLSDAADAVLLVDVGGNQGHDLLTFQQRHPDLKGRLVLQDLPESLEKMPARLEGIEVMPYDFFTPQPIKGESAERNRRAYAFGRYSTWLTRLDPDARAYFFRAICHDWSDKYCRDFLSHTARSMKKGYSSLLINDFVLPDTGTSLLPASLDILMMSFVAGAERTESQWRSLLDSVGLEIVKIWTVTAGAESVIETRLKTR